jgi:hypothetical protein
MFENILNWRLLKGSHGFPGPDGGTCINEAAIVAAGFKYHKVDRAEDCPPCFSRVIAGYAIRLNDRMPDDLRQELLMPFVVRLAGTADTREKEIERAAHIAVQTIKRILPISLRAIGLDDHAKQCAGAESLEAAKAAAKAAKAAKAAADAADAAAAAAAAANAAYAADAAADAAAYAADGAAIAAADAADAAGYAADAAANAANAAANAAKKEIFTIATAILDQAIRLGNQAAPIETAIVIGRMKAIQQRALERA